MNGWPAVAIIVVAQIAATVFPIRVAAPRWWHYLAISVLTIASVRPTAQNITGDVSRYLPAAIWSDGQAFGGPTFRTPIPPVIFVSRSVVGLVRSPHGVRGQPAALTLWAVLWHNKLPTPL